jgi:hypothetical protein
MNQRNVLSISALENFIQIQKAGGSGVNTSHIFIKADTCEKGSEPFRRLNTIIGPLDLEDAGFI